MNNFYKYLNKDIGLAESRCYDFARAIEMLHSAYCKLDIENGELLRKHGIVNLMKCYSTIEELRDIIDLLGIE